MGAKIHIEDNLTPDFIPKFSLHVILRHYVVVPLDKSTNSLKVNFSIDFPATELDSI